MVAFVAPHNRLRRVGLDAIACKTKASRLGVPPFLVWHSASQVVGGVVISSVQLLINNSRGDLLLNAVNLSGTSAISQSNSEILPKIPVDNGPTNAI